MLLINFDDERLIGMKASDLDSILKTYSSLFDLKPILFLDEIQNVEGWEHFARRLANQKYMVYITGSNAKMLSRDIASTLGARYIEQPVFPFSFHEFLRAKGIKTDKGWQYGKRKGEVERALTEYFTWGGFPELMLFKNKRHWLNELYEKIILGDIIARNKIKNETALRLALYRNAAYNTDEKVYFYNKEIEMDFYIPSKKKGIQAAFSLSDSNTLEREVKALTTFHRLYGLNEAEIVTYSESRTIETDSLTIRIRPLAEWLLDFKE